MILYYYYFMGRDDIYAEVAQHHFCYSLTAVTYGKRHTATYPTLYQLECALSLLKEAFKYRDPDETNRLPTS